MPSPGFAHGSSERTPSTLGHCRPCRNLAFCVPDHFHVQEHYPLAGLSLLFRETPDFGFHRPTSTNFACDRAKLVPDMSTRIVVIVVMLASALF